MIWIETKKILVVLVGALLGAISMNFSLIPANIYASGFGIFPKGLKRLEGYYANAIRFFCT